MRKYLLVLTLPLAFASCKQSKDEMLARKWKAVSVANPALDSMVNEREMFIDTFGKSNDAATNETIYGFKNVDSVRESLRAEWKDMRQMQQQAVENTWFDFKKTGIVVMNFSGQTDSSNWSIAKDGSLMLDQPKTKANAVSIKMEIIQLTDTSLKLRYSDQGGTSTVSFHPDSK